MKKEILTTLIVIASIIAVIVVIMISFRQYKGVPITNFIEPGVYPSVFSCLDLMPTMDLEIGGKKYTDSHKNEAYYIISFDNMTYDEFKDKYELTQVDVNGTTCSKIYDEGNEYGIKYRVYSSNYKENNVVKLHVLNKSDGKTKVLTVNCPLKRVY